MDRQPNRESVLQYAKDQYRTDPEYLWKKSPPSCCFKKTRQSKVVCCRDASTKEQFGT